VVWVEGGPYEAYVGRWSRVVAGRFVEWLAPAAGERWLDLGCGTGALTDALPDPALVVGVDRSAGFLRGRSRVAVADGGALPVRDGAVDRAVSGLVLNFLPVPALGVAEMVRVCRPGGVVAAYVWDYAEGMVPIKLFWDTAAALDPSAGALREGLRFPLCRPEPLAALFGGLGSVEVRAIDVAAGFRDFDDYWTPFLGGQGPAPAYCAALPPDARDRLRAALHDVLGDGPFTLPVRAWAVRGARPGTPPHAASTPG
jgi:SAM-dependent methyltransferase